jgi:hypothetical protein
MNSTMNTSISAGLPLVVGLLVFRHEVATIGDTLPWNAMRVAYVVAAVVAMIHGLVLFGPEYLLRNPTTGRQ